MARSVSPSDPLIVIVGSTGTGKSKLAVSLATKYNGEIINADAIQMYRGLPIVTNKIPEHEKEGIPHHLLDRIGLDQTPWTVNEFVDETSKIIREIRARGKLPIVVGGTNYYVFSLIFEESTLATASDSETTDGELPTEPGTPPSPPQMGSTTTSASDATAATTTTTTTNNDVDLSILNEPTEIILAKLRELDPVMASSWHPKDRRKIQRSLEICLKSGRKASEIYEGQRFIRGQQQQQAQTQQGFMSERTIDDQQDVDVDVDGHGHGPPLRYRRPLIFWLEAEDAVLKERLNARVDAMVRDGLLDEVEQMWKFARERRSTAGGEPNLNMRKGIWIAIGYKELEPWLDAREKTIVSSSDNIEDNTKESTSTALRDSGIEAIKAGTRQYAKRQHRWIRIRLAQHLRAANVFDHLFLLDGTDIQAWDEMVATPSKNITQIYLSGEQLPDNSSLSKLAADTFAFMRDRDKVSGRQARLCEICEKTLMTEEEWERHVKSNRHKKIVEGIRRRERMALARQKQDEEVVAV